MQSLKSAFMQKYPDRENILLYFEAANGVSATWGNLTKSRLSGFTRYLKEHVANSSARTYTAMLKTILTEYDDVIKLPRGWQQTLRVKKTVSEETWLTDEEIRLIANTTVLTPTENSVKAFFLLSCLTGARRSDSTGFTSENIQGENLVYVSKKTNVRSEIPLAPAAARIIKLVEKEKLPVVSEPTYNKTIKELCQKAGIDATIKLFQRDQYHTGEKWRFITSHTARRSFATNLYLRGADVRTIAMLMGHEDMQNTQRYIVCGRRELPENVLAYFRSFN